MMKMIPVEKISRNEAQPRKHFDGDALKELADSIKELGLLQPVLVRPFGDGFQLVAGERRWRACQMAGLVEMPAMVIDATDEQSFIAAIAENVNRKDMSVIEEAAAYQALIDTGKTLEEVAALFGKGRQTIQYRTDLLRLDPTLQKMAGNGQISTNMAWYLSKLSGNGQFEVLRKMGTGELKNEFEATRYAVAVNLRESESPLFDFGADEVERAAVKVKVSKWMGEVEKASAALDQLLDMDLDEIAKLGTETEILRKKLDILRSHAGQVRGHVAKAEAIVKAAS